MKNAKLGFIALASIVGIGSAFTNAPNKFAGQTYYVITDNAGGYTYSLSTTLSCQTPIPPVSAPYCTVQTKGGYTPVANTPIPVANRQSFTNANKLHF